MGIFNIFKKDKQENNTQREVVTSYIIEFPYRGKIGSVDGNEESSDEKFISGKEAFSYLDQESIDGINSSWNYLDMVYFVDDNIKNKISNMELSIKENGVCSIRVDLYDELSSEDRETLLNFVKGQASDGWGEGNFDYIYNKETKETYYYWDAEDRVKDENCIPFSLDFWWYEDGWYIKLKEPFTKDKAEWQYQSCLEEYCKTNNEKENEITEEDQKYIWECSGLLIAYFLTWLIVNNYIKTEEADINEESINAVKERIVKTTEFLGQELDYTLTRDDISEDILGFVDDYYSSGFYKEYPEYMEKNGKQIFCSEFSWEDYDNIEKIIDKAYEEYKNR